MQPRRAVRAQGQLGPGAQPEPGQHARARRAALGASTAAGGVAGEGRSFEGGSGGEGRRSGAPMGAVKWASVATQRRRAAMAEEPVARRRRPAFPVKTAETGAENG
ncbi:hypothetical protein PR202_ga22697 [Eleusine coracana subsp. coracana]|uniref:Uncharacterized protein n=1 Tax=Eleusine coracana subsp. coracana TaxID=191504 RepID=A0AAV5D3S5_ELECO|nr:hypothetical protein PR202_ga22697 [Eleusine coracana subsp. coracana]